MMDGDIRRGSKAQHIGNDKQVTGRGIGYVRRGCVHEREVTKVRYKIGNDKGKENDSPGNVL